MKVEMTSLDFSSIFIIDQANLDYHCTSLHNNFFVASKFFKKKQNENSLTNAGVHAATKFVILCSYIFWYHLPMFG